MIHNSCTQGTTQYKQQVLKYRGVHDEKTTPRLGKSLKSKVSEHCCGGSVQGLASQRYPIHGNIAVCFAYCQTYKHANEPPDLKLPSGCRDFEDGVDIQKYAT